VQDEEEVEGVLRNVVVSVAFFEQEVIVLVGDWMVESVNFDGDGPVQIGTGIDQITTVVIHDEVMHSRFIGYSDWCGGNGIGFVVV